MSDKETDLERTLQELSRMAKGTLRLVLGDNAVTGESKEAPETVLTPEVDAALEGAAHVVGDWLKNIGEDLQRQGGEVDPKEIDETGWSPLAVGAQALGEGLRVVGAELVSGLSGGEE